MDVKVKLRCRHCFQKMACGDDLVGEQVTCPSCRKKITIPAPSYDLGTKFNGFVLEQWLGNGAMGEVHLARQVSTDSLVAIKIIRREDLADKQDQIRFVMEAKNLAKLNHPNIVTAIQAGEFEDGAYLAMKYIEGITIEDKIKQQGSLTEHEALKVCETIADALEHAWNSFKIIHRDLKPANFMIDSKKKIHLMDMGIAKSVDHDMELTAVGIVMGTPYFMSPEQARGRKKLDFRSDIYSLGASLYNMVTGHPPFDESYSSSKVMSARLQKSPKNPKKHNPRLNKEVCKLIATLMHKDQKQRPGSWMEVKLLIKKTRRALKNKKSRSGSQNRKALQARSEELNQSYTMLYALSTITVIVIAVIAIILTVL